MLFRTYLPIYLLNWTFAPTREDELYISDAFRFLIQAESSGVKLSRTRSWADSSRVERSLMSQAVTIWSQLKPNQVPKGITNLQFASSSHPTFVRLNDNSRCSNLNSWFLTYIHGMRWEYDCRTNKRKLLGGFISFYDLTSSSHFCRNQETRYKIYNIL